jgi:uncharacterized protein YecT (DUF1311 family)
MHQPVNLAFIHMPMKNFLAICLLLPALANAASPCDKAVSDVEIRTCASKEFTTADRRLNEVYGRLNELLDPPARAKLKESQRAWIKYRDTNAEFSGDLNRGGSAETLNILGAKTLMTGQRVKELENEIEVRK